MSEKRAYHDSCFVNSRNRQARIVDVALDSRCPPQEGAIAPDHQTQEQKVKVGEQSPGPGRDAVAISLNVSSQSKN